MQDACTDSSGKTDCLWRVVCIITGASCPKMDAILKKLDDTEQETEMSNTAKNDAAATPKDVKEKAEKTTVPAQNSAEHDVKPDLAEVIEKDDTDKVLNNAGEVLFSGSPDEVRTWLNERPAMIYAVRQATNDGLVVSTVYVEKRALKLSLVQRAKAASEKLKQNKKALAILGGAAIIVGLTVKANRKMVSLTVENPYHVEDEGTTEPPVENPDDTPDSL